jgi:hypothetical protein
MFEALQEKLQILQTQKAELIQWKEWLAKPNNKSSKKVPLLDDDSIITEAIKRQLQEAEEQRAYAKTNEDKLRAAQALEEAKLADKLDKKRKLTTKHFFKQMPTVESVEARVQKSVRSYSYLGSRHSQSRRK